ncbi:hypothetical protein N825_20605 [Skermanella stibiiresistens SB22]|uniref:Uncharacterized protein n=1 Tax=Skermanella stibiiresistens SB22 TaxID=1385369 RepID=W9GTS8_9PROT|nr:hypothetical protein [Skermanella stibiiresistens]EWY37300.1 hypothetical protein N825_20605 [Skermanella stibiiresistens SB22]
MSLVTKALDKTVTARAPARRLGFLSSRPLSARLTLLVWLVLMSGIWAIVAITLNAVLGVDG